MKRIILLTIGLCLLITTQAQSQEYDDIIVGMATSRMEQTSLGETVYVEKQQLDIQLAIQRLRFDELNNRLQLERQRLAVAHARIQVLEAKEEANKNLIQIYEAAIEYDKFWREYNERSPTY